MREEVSWRSGMMFFLQRYRGAVQIQERVNVEVGDLEVDSQKHSVPLRRICTLLWDQRVLLA